MIVDDETIQSAVRYLHDGGDEEAASILRSVHVESCETVDHWMDGPVRLEGLRIEVSCPRPACDILNQSGNPFANSISNALRAVIPSDFYIKGIHARYAPGSSSVPEPTVPAAESREQVEEIVKEIDAQKSLMIAVATGGPRVNSVNEQFKERRACLLTMFDRLKMKDPNPYNDLWQWYGKWSAGTLPSYQSRRNYVTDLYQPTIDALHLARERSLLAQPEEPTGWVRVDRVIDKIYARLEEGKDEEDFQAVGLMCREAIISLAQAVYDPSIHGSIDGVVPSETDAKRMLESYVAAEIPGESNKVQRQLARATFDLSLELQHKRTATFRRAALCAEATRSVVTSIAIMAGRKDPK